MILAAGLGTRLRPWTLQHPKALVPVGGTPMVFRVMQRLVDAGFPQMGINVCHFADQLKTYLESPGLREWLERHNASVCISDETGKLLETGGGILKMGPLLDPEGEGFLVHNSDILSDADLGALREAHIAGAADVTLLTSRRPSSRILRFSPDGLLASWTNLKDGETKQLLEGGGEALAFAGIYIIGVKARREMACLYADNPFGIMQYLLDSRRKCKVMGVVQPNLKLLDVGKPDSLALAQHWDQ